MKKKILYITLLLSLTIGAACLGDNTSCGLGASSAEIDALKAAATAAGYPDTPEGLLNYSIEHSGEAMAAMNSVPLDQANSSVKAWSEANGVNTRTTAGVPDSSIADSKDANETVSPDQTRKDANKGKCSHVYNSVVTKEPNCTEEGIRTYTCEICGDTYEAPEAVNDQHDYEEEHKDPTCTEDGYNKKTCKLCGNEVVETLEATWHDYKTVTEKEPTCTEAGKEVQTCTACGDKVEKELPAFGHEYGGWNVTKEAGWFTQGEQESRCSVCNEILETQVIESRYPVYYLYIAIILIVVIIAAAITTAIITRKRRN